MFALVANLISLLLVTSLAVAPEAHATQPFTLDGAGVNTPCQASGCEAQLLTTAHGDDIIILIILVQECSTNCSVSSISDGSGLTFTKRLSFGPLLEYLARATSRLRSDNVTAVLPVPPIPGPCLLGDRGGGGCGMQVLAIHGGNSRAIFDPEPSIPATVTCTGSWSIGPTCGDCTADLNFGTCSASIQTSSADFVIASTAIADSGPCGAGGTLGYPHRVPGFTTLTMNGGGLLEVDYTIASTPQSKVVFNCNGTDVVAIVLDAISLREGFVNTSP